jgi:hypothetical protein
VEQGNRVPEVPFTVSVNAGPPTAALDGESGVVMTGTGRLVVGVVMEKVAEFDVVIELDTVTAAVPEKAVSAAVMAAVSCVEFTNVVARSEPFQFTTSPFTKLEPFTASVSPFEAQNGVEEGASDEMAGATIENEIALEVPPPGDGLNTMTETDATTAISVLEIAAWSWVELTYVVFRPAPFHWTTEHGTKLLPVTLNVNPTSPAVAVEGDNDVMAGTGSEPEGVEIVKATEFDATAKFVTVTFADPAEAISAVEISAVSCVGLTNVVARVEPFQFTSDAFTKFVPVTVNVKPETLHDGVVFDEVVEADSDVMAGGTIVNGREAADAPPPGPRLNAETFAVWTVPAPTRSAAGITALSVAAPPPLPAT